MTKGRAYACIIIAAALWGLIGFFVKGLTAQGFSAMQITFFRTLSASICITPLLYLSGRKNFSVALKDLWLFFGTGVISLTFFNYCYFNCIEETSLAVAALILYTAPAIVMLLSILLFKEKFTKEKGFALVLTFLGCGCVTGVFSGKLELSLLGLLLGLGSGLGYALYSIFSKFALPKYEPLTISAYTFYFACITTGFLADFNGEALAKINLATILYSSGLGLICCLAPYVLYTKGLEHIEAGRASVLATVEPLVAAIVGVCLFNEALTITKVLGMVLIFSAIGILELKK